MQFEKPIHIDELIESLQLIQQRHPDTVVTSLSTQGRDTYDDHEIVTAVLVGGYFGSYFTDAFTGPKMFAKRDIRAEIDKFNVHIELVKETASESKEQ